MPGRFPAKSALRGRAVIAERTAVRRASVISERTLGPVLPVSVTALMIPSAGIKRPAVPVPGKMPGPVTARTVLLSLDQRINLLLQKNQMPLDFPDQLHKILWLAADLLFARVLAGFFHTFAFHRIPLSGPPWEHRGTCAPSAGQKRNYIRNHEN